VRNAPRRFLSVFFVLAVATVAPGAVLADAADMLRLSLRGVEVRYHDGDAGIARQAGLALQASRDDAEDRLGIRFGDAPVLVILAHGRDEYEAAGTSKVPEWSLAVALPSRRAVVVDAAQVVPNTANDLRPVIAHELAHLALAQVEVESRRRFPLWFHEGVAVTFSGVAPLRGDRSRFRIAAAQGALIPFDDLENRFPEDPGDADLAYLQSEAFVAWLYRTESRAVVATIIATVREGANFDEAFERTVGAPRAAMEKKWAASHRKRLPWLRIAWEVTTLLGVMAAGTIVAFLIVRIRNRRQHKRWLAEERLWTVVEEDDENDGEESENPWGGGFG